MRRNSRLLSERPRGLTVSISQILLRHFGDRLRLRSHFDQETIGSASVRMMAILVKKKVTGARAARAVEETLDLAASVVLTDHQRDMARSRIDVGQRAAKELCRRFDLFVSEVAALTSKFQTFAEPMCRTLTRVRLLRHRDILLSALRDCRSLAGPIAQGTRRRRLHSAIRGRRRKSRTGHTIERKVALGGSRRRNQAQMRDGDRGEIA